MDPERVRRALVAAGEGDAESLERLLAETPSLANAVGDNPFWGGRCQPLHLSVSRDRDACTALLLAAGADPSGLNDGYGGWSPLLIAAFRGRDGTAARLEAAGASVGFFEAAALGRAAEVGRLLDEDPARARAMLPDRTTPLHVAATDPIAARLLDDGADPDATSAYGGTPLDAATARAARGEAGGVAIARRLLDAGATADAATFAALGDLEGLAGALDRDPGALDRTGRAGVTPLRAAAAHGRLAAVEWLLERGADPDATGREGITPLHAVAGAPSDAEAIARRLLAAGADPRRRDGAHDATPASWADFQGRERLAAVLREAAGDGVVPPGA